MPKKSSKKNLDQAPARRRGRPPVDDEVARQVVARAREGGAGLSRRALAREFGLAGSTVGRILAAAGFPSPKAGPRAAPPPAEPLLHDDPGAERVNMRAVAEAAGVSLFTASLALRGSEKVAKPTRKRVEEVAARLGYQVHPYVSAQLAAVRRGRSAAVRATIGYLFADLRGTTWDEALGQPYGPRARFEAALLAARSRGYSLDVFRLEEPGRNPKRLQTILESRGIRGLLLDFPPQAAVGCTFDFSRFNCASFHEQTEFAPHVFSHNNFHNLMLLFCRLWLQGYRRIGFAMSDSVSVADIFRRDAAVRHCTEHLVPWNLRLPLFHFESCADAIKRFLLQGKTPPDRNRCEEHRWLLSHDWSGLLKTLDPGKPDDEAIHLALLRRWIEDTRPEVIICEHNAFLPRLKKLGLRVPQDIGLAHCNLHDDVAGWTGIRNGDDAMAQAAVEELTRSIELGRIGLPVHPLHVRFVGKWIEGTTTRKIKKPLTPLTEPAARFIRRVLNQPVLG